MNSNITNIYLITLSPKATQYPSTILNYKLCTMNNLIVSLHRREALRDIRLFEKTRIKLTHKLSDLSFLIDNEDRYF